MVVIILDELSDKDNYFPELTLKHQNGINGRYGIYNVNLSKNDNVITGFQWHYSYWNGEKMRNISSYDLRILRDKVLNIGHEWIITDNKLAIDSYKLNNKLLSIRKKYLENKKSNKPYKGSSGVANVTKANDKRYNYTYWRYMKNNICIYEKQLHALKQRVIELGEDWIVKDEELYNKNILKEKESWII